MFFEKDAVSYIIESVLRSNITLWNLNDLHSKKSIPAWEGYDEADNLFWEFPKWTKGPLAEVLKRIYRFHSHGIGMCAT